MFPTSILQGTYNQTSGGDSGSPFTGLIFGYNHTITPTGFLGIYDDGAGGSQAPPGSVGVGNPFYFINFGPGTFDSDQDARALNYTKDLVSWITNTAVADVALNTNYNISSSDFSRLTVGSGGTNGDGNFTGGTFAYFEPASSGSYIKLVSSSGQREYAVLFYGLSSVSNSLNDNTVGSFVPGQYWKKTT